MSPRRHRAVQPARPAPQQASADRTFVPLQRVLCVCICPTKASAARTGTLIADCQQGLELGFSPPGLWAWATQIVFVRNQVAVRFVTSRRTCPTVPFSRFTLLPAFPCNSCHRYGDNYGWPTEGFLHVSNSIFHGNDVDWRSVSAASGKPHHGRL